MNEYSMISNKVNLRADARFKPIKGGCVWIFRFAILAMFEIGRFWVFRGSVAFDFWFSSKILAGFHRFSYKSDVAFGFFLFGFRFLFDLISASTDLE